MSAFDDYWDAKAADLGSRGGYIYKQEKAAWNAALDRLEGLAEGWEADGVRVGPNRRSHTATAAAIELKARIKELRT